jgi:hypothetical protein
MRSLLPLLILACQSPALDSGLEEPQGKPLAVEPLSDTRLLRRMSLELKGVLPSLEDLEAVEEDPDALAVLREEMLEDPLFEERLVQIFSQRWHTRVDEFNGHYYDYFLQPDEEYAFERAVGEEPLRLMARVVATDQPWSDVVVSESSMANELLASIWPMEGYPEDGQGWHPVRYTDNRPAVGVLATNGLWWRYFTTFFNQNRSRAAAISKLLLCEDLLNRPISFSENGDLLAAEDVTGMVLSEPTCQGCHVTIEPLAATLFGFWWMNDNSAPEMQTYHPEREVLGSVELGVEPSYFGKPIAGFAELGHAIAEDERFSRCAVQSMAEALWHRPVGLYDFEALELAHTRFVGNELRIKPLLLDLLATEEYAAGGLRAEADEETAERIRTARLLDASLIRSLSLDLTGLHWENNGFDLLDNDEHGYRILAGGVDGEYVSTLQADPGLTWALVIRRVSQAMANQVVSHDLVDAAQPPILLQLSLDSRPGDEDFEDGMDQLFFRLMGQRADVERLAGLTELWEELESLDGANSAWQGVISALFQDPDFIVY